MICVAKLTPEGYISFLMKGLFLLFQILWTGNLTQRVQVHKKTDRDREKYP
jgi:hypothetical protein